MKKGKYSFYEYCILNNKQEILEMWDYDKNELLPQDIAFRSMIPVHMKCLKGHSWEEAPTTLILKNSCPYCNHQRVSAEYNLQVIYPDIAKMWNYEKNYPYRPVDIFPTSGKKFWWRCENGHEFQDSPNSLSDKKGCVYCNKEKISQEYNFKKVYPKIALEWDYEKNKTLPEEYFPQSAVVVYWKCPFNPVHRWPQKICDRIKNKLGCPECKKELKTSFPEQAIYYYLKKNFPDTVNKYYIDKRELDIYIPSLNLGIEYDGVYHHKKKLDKDLAKEKVIKAKNINFIRIKEVLEQNKQIIFRDNVLFCLFDYKYRYLNEIIKLLFDYIKEKYHLKIAEIDIDISKDELAIYDSYLNLLRENTIGEKNPQLIKEWDFTKNGLVTPFMVSRGSGVKYWWQCPKGHSYLASPLHRSVNNRGCPYCAHRLISYEDSLQNLNPLLCELWDKEKNGDLTPLKVSPQSSRKVNWYCKVCKNEWVSAVRDMTTYSNCPYCNNRRLTAKNNLAVLCPDLMKEWDYERNPKEPSKYFKSSPEKVWWKCPKGHNYEARINNRVYLKRGCSYCGGKKVLREDSFGEKYPELLKEWNYEKNKNLDPYQLSICSNKKVWWQCNNCQNEWQADIMRRTKGKCGCRRCSYVRRRESILNYPHIMQEWCYEKNQGLNPTYLSPGSGKKAWWHCYLCGHEWATRISHRFEGSKCPQCHYKKDDPQKESSQ